MTGLSDIATLPMSEERLAMASLATATIIGSAAWLVARVDALALDQRPGLADLHWAMAQLLACILEAAAVAVWIVNARVDL
jgi:hypothetical protein